MAILSIAQNIIWHRDGSIIRVYCPESKAYAELKGTSADIWMRLKEPICEDDLAAALLSDYSLPKQSSEDTISRDLDTFLNQLAAEKLIVSDDLPKNSPNQ